ncbi:MAG: 1-acyl-sn-glycerol-3-phosphate acyltransferase [Bacteroidota bacterium]
MSVVKNILGRIFALWALLVFVISMLIFWIPIWLVGFWPEPKRSIHFFKIVHVWMAMFFIFSGVRRKIRGRHHFKKNQTYIVTCNHNSFMDVPLSSADVPAPHKTIAKIEMMKIPIFGTVYKRGSVLVNRKNEESRRASFAKMKATLAMGMHMCIYPEGTRNKTNEPLQKFHDGAFKLAIETGTSIIPAIIFNTRKVLPTHKTFFFWPQPVELHFLPEVPVHQKTVAQLKEEVFGAMKDFILQHQKS